MADLAENMICSFQLAGLPPNGHVFIALDRPTLEAMRHLGARAILFDKEEFAGDAAHSRKLIDFYDIVKVKPTFVHQLLLWNVDAITIDADMVFLEDALSLFHDLADIPPSFRQRLRPVGSESRILQDPSDAGRYEADAALARNDVQHPEDA
jgi:hypothetical protein